MTPFLAFIRLLADPTIVALLFSTGSIGLPAQLYSPHFVTRTLGGLRIPLPSFVARRARGLVVPLGADRAGDSAAKRRWAAANPLGHGPVRARAARHEP